MKRRACELLRLNVHSADENGTNRLDSMIVLVSHQMQTVVRHHLMLQVNQKIGSDENPEKEIIRLLLQPVSIAVDGSLPYQVHYFLKTSLPQYVQL